MRRVVPFRTIAGALRSLDNGGRFFNMLTKAGDGSITKAEVYKAAGVSSGTEQAQLYLNLALSRLSNAEQREVISHLSDGLRRQLRANPPQHVAIPRFEESVATGSLAIIEGVPRFLEDTTRFQGFITIPIMAGKVMTFTQIPIFEKYDIYEVYSDYTLSSAKTIIAAGRGSGRLPPARTTVGGVVKEFESDSDTTAPDRLYTEALYYIIHSDDGERP